MFVKSVSIKSPDLFSKAVHYALGIGKEGQPSPVKVFHNVHSIEPDKVAQEMRLHDKTYRKKRKGGVCIFHEILSFHPSDREKLLNNPAILEDIATKFISLRGERAQVVAGIHTDKKHVHIHCTFGAVEYKSSKSLRISKARFKSIKKELELYQVQKYPELKASVCFLNKKQKERILKQEFPDLLVGEKEQQLKKRTGKKTDKETVSEMVKNLYLESKSQDDFFHKIIEAGLSVYKYRNKVNGVYYKSYRYRFRTLSLTDEHIRLLEKNYSRLKELEQLFEKQQQSREPEKEL